MPCTLTTVGVTTQNRSTIPLGSLLIECKTQRKTRRWSLRIEDRNQDTLSKHGWISRSAKGDRPKRNECRVAERHQTVPARGACGHKGANYLKVFVRT